jgi:hypothetical protein
MTNPAHPGRMLFVNLPVADLERSKAFFAHAAVALSWVAVGHRRHPHARAVTRLLALFAPAQPF